MMRAGPSALVIAKAAKVEAGRARRSGNLLDAHQAAEKVYLAVVTAAREIVICAGSPEPPLGRVWSSRAIGDLQRIAGERGLLAKPSVAAIHRVATRALGQHTACFYDGICSPAEVYALAMSAEKAIARVPDACAIAARSRPA